MTTLSKDEVYAAIDRMAAIKFQSDWESSIIEAPSEQTRTKAKRIINEIASLGDVNFKSVLPVSGGIFLKLELYVEPERLGYET